MKVCENIIIWRENKIGQGGEGIVWWRASAKSWSRLYNPVVVTDKKCGDSRLCLDFRQLNDHVKLDEFPVPEIAELMLCTRDGNISRHTTLRIVFSGANSHRKT